MNVLEREEVDDLARQLQLASPPFLSLPFRPRQISLLTTDLDDDRQWREVEVDPSHQPAIAPVAALPRRLREAALAHEPQEPPFEPTLHTGVGQDFVEPNSAVEPAVSQFGQAMGHPLGCDQPEAYCAVEGVRQLVAAHIGGEVDDGEDGTGGREAVHPAPIEGVWGRAKADRTHCAAAAPRPRGEELEGTLVESLEAVQRRRCSARYESIVAEIKQAGLQPAPPREHRAREPIGVRANSYERAGVHVPLEGRPRHAKVERLRARHDLVLVGGQGGEGAQSFVHASKIAQGVRQSSRNRQSVSYRPARRAVS
jgi:hypothetical protein